MEESLRQPEALESVPNVTTGTGAEPPLAPSNCSAADEHYVWAAVNTLEGDRIDHLSIVLYEDETDRRLIAGWEWRRFKLMPAQQQNDKDKRSP